MGKKTSWFSFFKRLFLLKSKSTTNEKQAHKKWRLAFHRLQLRQYPLLPISSASQKLLKEAREEQRKQALAVAMATAAAAKAAVAAANAAAEVVEFLGIPESYIEHLNRKQILAATRIQAAYRAFLARKALRALKGLVRLQAIVRGRIARRRSNVLKFLPLPLAKTRSLREGENTCFLGEKQLKLNCKSYRSWDYSIFSKEDLEALQLRKQEATSMRDRMKKYSSSHRERRINEYLENSMIDNGRMMSPLLEVEGAGINGSRKRELSKSRSTVSSNFIEAETFIRMQSSLRKEEPDSPIALPRRSFNRTEQKSVLNDSCMVNSPALPTYMAATESVKAKLRSTSTPRLRLGTYDQDFPYKSRIF
ncbi:protein IQ-DOMAIN 12-like [Impatiens glandulifera]|uniref:protein IQ-DOMAIN 12-like n=1 Tax=Impatiens glandulifera TaxID=253017 RepID=UPI001FB0D6AA|nr:protein IQ-DOMAIN 12-like [Impatiens glandulifera]